MRGVQLAVTTGAFWYLSTSIDWPELRTAMARMSWSAVLATCVLYYLALGLGAVRWKLLLRVMGAPKTLQFGYLYRMYVVGLFYNTFVPGGVGGDVVRGLATRAAFGPGGAASSLAVVLIERAMGLGGMCFVVAAATALHPLPGVSHLSWVGVVGVLMSLGGFVGLAVARRIAPVVPGALGKLASNLPQLKNLGPMPWCVATAIGTHMLAGIAGYLLISAVSPEVSFMQAMTIVPLSLAAAYLPLSIGGVGVVELALVELLAVVGVGHGDALVAALSLRACQWAVAAPGGLLSLAGHPPPERALLDA